MIFKFLESNLVWYFLLADLKIILKLKEAFPEF